jgi:hypothetical protein
MKNAVVIVLIIAAIGGGFFAGMKYQQSKNFFQARMANRQDRAQFQPNAQAGMIRGEIISADEESITIKLQDESSKIVLLSENTEINKTTQGSAQDLKEGETVMVFGQTNSDGSLSATNIQLGERLLPRGLEN